MSTLPTAHTRHRNGIKFRYRWTNRTCFKLRRTRRCEYRTLSTRGTSYILTETLIDGLSTAPCRYDLPFIYFFETLDRSPPNHNVKCEIPQNGLETNPNSYVNSTRTKQDQHYTGFPEVFARDREPFLLNAAPIYRLSRNRVKNRYCLN